MPVVSAFNFIHERTRTFHKPLLARTPETILKRLVASVGCQLFSTLITNYYIFTFGAYFNESHNDLHGLLQLILTESSFGQLPDLQSSTTEIYYAPNMPY